MTTIPHVGKMNTIGAPMREWLPCVKYGIYYYKVKIKVMCHAFWLQDVLDKIYVNRHRIVYVHYQAQGSYLHMGASTELLFPENEMDVEY